jgi:hypothetical protein
VTAGGQAAEQAGTPQFDLMGNHILLMESRAPPSLNIL